MASNEAVLQEKEIEGAGRDPKDPFEDKKLVKVLLAEPSVGYVDSFVHDNRLDAYMEFARFESRSNFKFFTGNVARTHVSYARELMADEAIRLGMDYLWMVDDDMLIPPNCFERMFKSMEETGADVIAPLCTQRLPPYKPVLYKIVKNIGDGKEGKKEGQEYWNFHHVEDYPLNGKVELDAVGFGVVLIKTELLKKIPKPRFFSNTHVGEDLFFCYQAKQAGGKIMADTRIKIGHLGYPIMRTEYDFLKNANRNDDLKKMYPNLSAASRIEQFNEQ